MTTYPQPPTEPAWQVWTAGGVIGLGLVAWLFLLAGVPFPPAAWLWLAVAAVVALVALVVYRGRQWWRRFLDWQRSPGGVR